MFLDSDTVLDVRNVSKRFSHNYSRARKQLLKTLWLSCLGRYDKHDQLQSSEFFAVRNVSFQLKRGETLGLIGLNGSGKSTLLKMISGIYLPDHGEINIEGEVGGLIELNAGIQPTLTGRENIFIKGAILGRRRAEMESLTEAIIEFAELGEFMDSPVKTYSSGMKMRLGFSIAIHMQPDILLMDEVMAVGDFQFRQKCLDRVNALRETTATIFVSHSMDQVSMFCDRAIMLKNGVAVYEGAPKDTIKHYMSTSINTPSTHKTKAALNRPFFGDVFANNNKITAVTHEWWPDNDSPKVDLFQTLRLRFSFRLRFKPRELQIGIPVWLVEERRSVAVFPYDLLQDPEIEVNSAGVVTGELEFKCYLNPGTYISTFNVRDGPEFLYRMLNVEFVVNHGPRVYGYVTLPHKWRFGDGTRKLDTGKP